MNSGSVQNYIPAVQHLSFDLIHRHICIHCNLYTYRRQSIDGGKGLAWLCNHSVEYALSVHLLVKVQSPCW